MYYVHKISVTCLALCSASETDAETHSKANHPFISYSGKAARETLLSFSGPWESV